MTRHDQQMSDARNVVVKTGGLGNKNMNHSTRESNATGILDMLERYVRSQLNLRSMLILLAAFTFCAVQFYGRGQILKKVPDKHWRGISHQQLDDFIRDPARSDDDSNSNHPAPKSSSAKASPTQTPTANRPNPARPFLIYYAVTEATTDVAFPLVYGTLSGMLLWVFFGREGRWTLLLPLTIVICDLTENATMIWFSLTFAYHPSTEKIPDWATWPTNIKWGFALVAILIVSYGVIKKLTSSSPAPTSK